jgi:methionyl aminopeptidase
MGKNFVKFSLAVNQTYCGHGIGKYFHVAPNVPHYANSKVAGFMKPGHVFTIEPMINAGVQKDITWPDKWTAVTADGQRSSQFEHTILIT